MSIAPKSPIRPRDDFRPGHDDFRPGYQSALAPNVVARPAWRRSSPDTPSLACGMPSHDFPVALHDAALFAEGRMSDPRQISSLIGDIYDAVLDKSLWIGVLGRAAHFVGAQ